MHEVCLSESGISVYIERIVNLSGSFRDLESCRMNHGIASADYEIVEGIVGDKNKVRRIVRTVFNLGDRLFRRLCSLSDDLDLRQ